MRLNADPRVSAPPKCITHGAHGPALILNGGWSLPKAFGHAQPKPTALVGTAQWLEDLQAQAKEKRHGAKKSKRDKLFESRVESGKVKITGIHKKLKASQVYPVQFALALVRHHWPSIFGQ